MQSSDAIVAICVEVGNEDQSQISYRCIMLAGRYIASQCEQCFLAIAFTGMNAAEQHDGQWMLIDEFRRVRANGPRCQTPNRSAFDRLADRLQLGTGPQFLKSFQIELSVSAGGRRFVARGFGHRLEFCQ